MTLPGTPPQVLQEALATMPEQVVDKFIHHLTQGTSASYLSDWLARWGTPVGATTLKDYRRSLRQIGVC